MPLPSNPLVLAYLLENYEKEARLRNAWSSKHVEQFKRAATFSGELKNYSLADIEYARNVAGLATITRDHIASTGHRMTARMPDYMSAKADCLRKEDPIMIPVDQETEKLINGSREEYFKRRYKMNPEDKFYYPETGNWRYGWRLKDCLIKMQKPTHPRINHMASAMFSRVGLQPDPSYNGDPNQMNTFGTCP